MAYLFFIFVQFTLSFGERDMSCRQLLLSTAALNFKFKKKPVKTNLAFISVTITNIFHPEPFSASSLVFVDPPPKEKKSRKSTSHIG